MVISYFWVKHIVYKDIYNGYIYILYTYIYMGMAQETGMDRSAVIRTYGTRSCQQAFDPGPCHKGLHGYEYNLL